MNFKKEKELKESINLVYGLGILIFSLSALMSIYEAVKMIIFPTFFGLMSFFAGCLLFVMGTMLVTFSISMKNALLRRIPERW
jgi:hypothetical protein